MDFSPHILHAAVVAFENLCRKYSFLLSTATARIFRGRNKSLACCNAFCSTPHASHGAELHFSKDGVAKIGYAVAIKLQNEVFNALERVISA